MRQLKNYWAEKVVKFDKVKLYTSLKPEFSCGIANVGIEGMKASEIDNYLFTKYKIFTVGISWEKIEGIRVTPHVYTKFDDLDRLVDGIYDLSRGKKL